MRPRIVVTDHARRRWQERARVPLEDLDSLARSAWKHGLRARKSRRSERGERRIYMGHTFVFEPGPEVVALLTVFPPPHG